MSTTCMPHWYVPPNQTTCPFGEVWLGSITRPYVWVEGYPGLSFAGVVVNVGFSLMPYIVGLCAALTAVYAAFYQEGGCCFTWRIGERLGATQVWRVRVLQQVAKFLLFCLIVVVSDTILSLLFKIPEAFLDTNQRWFYFSPRRPERSCITSCSMPSADTFWAIGILAYLVIESCMMMMMPHLTKERIDPNSAQLREYLRRRRGGRDVEMQSAAQPMLGGDGLTDHEFPTLARKYDDKQMMWMGISPIATSTFVSRVFVATILLGPVPAARINLADATFEQVAVGCVLGVLFACVFHSFWVLYFRKQSRAERFRNLLVGGVMLLRNPCNACRIVAALFGDAAAPGSEPPGDESSLYVLPSVDPGLMEEVPSRLRRDGLMMNIPGFEFMAISTDAEVFVKEVVDDFERRRFQAQVQRGANLENIVQGQRQRLDEEVRRVEDLGNIVQGQQERLDEEVRRGEDLQNLIKLQHEQFERVAEIPPQIHEKTTKGNIEDLKQAIEHSCETLSHLEQSSMGSAELHQSFRNLKKLVEPTLAEARSRHKHWVILFDKLKAAISGKKHIISQPGEPKKKKRLLHQTAERVYTAFAECISDGIAVPQLVTDDRTKVTHEVKGILLEWQGAFAQAAHRSRDDRAQLYNSLLDKVTMTEDNEDYGDFCFTDLDRCLRIIRLLPSDETLRVCSTELGKRRVKEIRQFLEKFKDLTQFLGYLEKERIDQTVAQFRARNLGHGGGPDGLASALMEDICREYEEKRPEVVSSADMKSAISDPGSVLDLMRGRGPDGPLGVFQDIFVRLAELRIARYGVLVAPHLPQLVLLLMFKEFLRRGGEGGSMKTLIAQVGTGEGKSMLIACLAAYVVMSSRNGAGRYEKKVHVVGGDERLVSRDFGEFEELFASCFGSDAEHAMMLRKDDKITDEVYEKVWGEDMHIIFCLPHHIALLYSKEAKGARDFSGYDNCVLLIDEVDSLIVDDSPNAPILYDSWTKQGREGRAQTARDIAEQFGSVDLLQTPGARKPTERDYADEGQRRICREVRKFWGESRPENYKGLAERYEAPGGEFDEYVKKDKDGKPDHLLQDNLLEVLNFRYRMESERKAPAAIRWLERGFIVSKPWCFTKYSKILGFTGTTGNSQEEDFIRNVYDAQIIRAPAFLDCCEKQEKPGVKWSTEFPVPVDTSTGDAQHSSFVVVESEATQSSYVARVAIAACEKVPVLVIARDLGQADLVLRRLRSEAARKFKDFSSTEIVQDLTARVFERSAGDYRSVLTRATERAGPDPDDQFRITVTDKSGGRGTDYRMDDVVADSHGGLLVVMMHIPLEERDWVQNRGRTARQDRHGQIVAVLHRGDYDLEALPPAEGEAGAPARPLPEELYRGGTHAVAEDPEGVKDAILRYGQRRSQATMARVGREFAAGMHANNLCEKFWARAGAGAPPDAGANERFLHLLRTYSTRSIEDMNGHVSAILGRDIRGEPGWRFPDAGTNVPRKYQGYEAEVIKPSQKIFVFCLDISGSMAGSRLNTCKRSLVEMMRNHTSDGDIRTLVPFNDKFNMWPDLTEDAFAEKVESLRAGGQTEMKYAMKKCIEHLVEQRDKVARRGEFRPIPCFIVLTDGEDGSEEAADGSKVAKASADEISGLLRRSVEPPYVFGCITLGDVGTSDADMDEWCKIVTEGHGRAFKKSATCSSESIEETFAAIGEGLALDDDGIAVD